MEKKFVNQKGITAMFQYCVNQIPIVEKQLHEDVSPNVELGNILRNFRSILEYLAYEIKHVYDYEPQSAFPYNKVNEKQFIKYVNQKFPNLKEDHPQLYDVLNDVQPYKKRNNWVELLCDYTNVVKHNYLEIDKNKKKKSLLMPLFGRLGEGCEVHNIRLEFPDRPPMDIHHLKFDGDKITVADGRNIFIIIEERSQLLLKDSQVDLIEFLYDTTNGLHKLVPKVYEVMEKEKGIVGDIKGQS